eukprot:1360737-Prorocentrum_lima.AAC.1
MLPELRARAAKARRALGQLRRILASSVLQAHTKRLLVLTFVRTRFLYGAESWPSLSLRELAVIEGPFREAM